MIEICGRKIRVRTGTKSQTVNICGETDSGGNYDYVVRIPPPFVSPDDLAAGNFRSIEDLVASLERNWSGEVERRPSLRQSTRTAASAGRHALVDCFQDPRVNRFSSVAAVAAELSGSEIVARFEQQRNTAPRRGLFRNYFVGHSGQTTSGVSTNRLEEHLAIALWSEYRHSGMVLPDRSVLFPVDYQLPLKSHRDDANAGLGKVDLLCADQDGEPWVAELKMSRGLAGTPDTPLRALIEALAYCATLDPDMKNLSRESSDKKRSLLRVVNPSRPNLLVLAPAEYWRQCEDQEKLHPWKQAVGALSHRIEAALGIRVKSVRMENCRWATGNPKLLGPPAFEWADRKD